MSETKLFRLVTNSALEIPAQTMAVEKSLQTLLEQNLELILGIRFLATEYSTGKNHGGRIDTLGLDDDAAPVIIEYKRAMNENVINQGLFYLDWLLDHKADFKLLVMEKLGAEVAATIDWSGPRLVCIAADFNKYDGYAVQQMNRNIDLIRYRKYGDDILALELVNRAEAKSSSAAAGESGPKPTKSTSSDTTASNTVPASGALADIHAAVRAHLLALGDDVQEKQLKLYVAYRRIKNFASVVVMKKSIVIYLRLNPNVAEFDESFMRDVSKIGHWATGDLEITLTNMANFHRIQPLLLRAYEEA